MSAKTTTALVLSTIITGKKNYIHSLSHRSWDGRKLPSYTHNLDSARLFIDYEHANRMLTLMVNPHNREFEIEEIQIDASTQQAIITHDIN